MPAPVILSRLSWSAPDGSPVVSDLTLTFGPERTGIVGRNGSGKSTLLRLIAGDLRPASGSVRADGTVGFLRQDLAAPPGAILADLFAARAGLALIDRAEAGQATAAELAEADWLLPGRIAAALTRLGLEIDPRVPLDALSGGQRTRAALAALVSSEPDILLLDEPTNNLDGAGRAAVAALIRDWPGTAITVSHDRGLLDEMDAIVELSALGATRYGGNFTDYRAWKAAEIDAAERDLAQAEQARDEATRRARQAAERKARRDGRGRRDRARGGQAKSLLDFAKARAEASGGANARLREARRDAAEDALAQARARIELVQPVQMEIPPCGLPAGRTVLRLESVSAGHHGAHRLFCDLSLTVTGPERIAVHGPNGSGKTTFVRLVTGQIAPLRGSVTLAVPHAVLDQDLAAIAPDLTLRETFLRHNPGAGEQRAHAVLARFGFRAGDALRPAGALSGGERLRAGLACALGRDPAPMLLILDEPTNHLDLDGIAALETALAAYDGALVVVSHDAAFLDSLAPDRVLTLGA